MDEPFSLRVVRPAWRSAAQDWITDQVVRSGGVLTGEIDQRRVRPWSTQLVAPTDRGPAWFKANCRALAFEPAVQRELSRLVPDEGDAPLGLDVDRGWMLTTDRGTTLGDGHEPTLDDWRAVVRLAATLQRRVAGSGAALLAAGLPDCAPATVPARYAWLVDQLADLPGDHPSHVGADEAATLRATVGRVEQAVEELLAGPLPSTFQHGDLHPKNVFAVDSGLRIFDFGDAQWAHPLEVLAVPYGWITQLTQLPWRQVLDAYAEVWSDLVSREALERLMSAAMVTHAVNRSFTWWGSIEGAQAAELVEWGDAPAYYLRLTHAPFAPVASGDGADGS
jgi:hypothetical protein